MSGPVYVRTLLACLTMIACPRARETRVDNMTVERAPHRRVWLIDEPTCVDFDIVRFDDRIRFRMWRHAECERMKINVYVLATFQLDVSTYDRWKKKKHNYWFYDCFRLINAYTPLNAVQYSRNEWYSCYCIKQTENRK